MGGDETGGGERPVRAMSFNLRYGTAADGENAWEHRREFVADTVRAFAPDLLGTQESLAFQRDELAARLPGYAAFAAGRDDGREAGEMAAIFYRTDRFEKLDGGHFWLSETPGVPGSKSWDSALPRVASWAKLRDKTATGGPGGVLWFFNTHFDHRGERARLESAKLLRKKIAAIAGDGPVILTGDFNAAPGSDPYRALFETPGAPRLVDTYRVHHPADPGEAAGTFSGFLAANRGGPRIDWIAASPGWTVESAAIDRTHRDGRTPSDHFPVTAVLRRESR